MDLNQIGLTFRTQEKLLSAKPSCVTWQTQMACCSVCSFLASSAITVQILEDFTCSQLYFFFFFFFEMLLINLALGEVGDLRRSFMSLKKWVKFMDLGSCLENDWCLVHKVHKMGSLFYPKDVLTWTIHCKSWRRSETSAALAIFSCSNTSPWVCVL